MSPPKHFAVRQNFSNEMYDCIQTSSPQSSTPQHVQQQQQQQQQESDTTSSTVPGSSSSSPGTLHSQNGTANGGNGNAANAANGNIHNQKTKPTLERFEIDQHSPNYEYDFDDYIEDNNNNNNSGHEDRPSNENLLGTAFVTFMGFALIQTVVAYFAKSEAMLGDSAAMIVDALTYLFNYCAERKKAQFNNNDDVAATAASLELPSLRQQPQVDRETQQRILERTKRKMVLQLELAPPMISVSTLIVVTIFVLRHSIEVLILDAHRSASLQGNPNIHIMMYFSIANLFLDLVNVANFAKAKHLFGYETNDQAPEGHTMLSSNEDDDHHNGDNHNGNNKRSRPQTPRKDGDDDDDDYEEDQEHTANLNMCSAYTHVFADTLRSMAVLVAACLSVLVPEITAEEADASAAVVVSALIILSLVPLVKGLLHTSQELKMIHAEEKSDKMAFSS